MRKPKSLFGNNFLIVYHQITSCTYHWYSAHAIQCSIMSHLPPCVGPTTQVDGFINGVPSYTINGAGEPCNPNKAYAEQHLPTTTTSVAQCVATQVCQANDLSKDCTIQVTGKTPWWCTPQVTEILPSNACQNPATACNALLNGDPRLTSLFDACGVALEQCKAALDQCCPNPTKP